MIASPIVIITTEKVGRPTIRCRIARSMPKPTTAIRAIASGTATRNGNPATEPNAYTRYAPRSMSSPCAKLMTSVAL